MTREDTTVVHGLALVLACLAASGAGGDEQPAAEAPYRGLAVQIHQGRNPVEEYGPLIREVADLGADTILLSADGLQENIDSIVIDIEPERVPGPDQWLELFRIAHDSGLRVVLMPKVLLRDPRDGSWRGQIAPTSWEAWFEQYRRFVLHFAEVARRGSVDVLLIGSELVTTERHTEQWRRIIREVRAVYPGKVGYSANWDHYKNIQFWGDLDLIGLTTYNNLNKPAKAHPTVDDLVEAWKPIRGGILHWQKEIDRPLLFTEVGWCSQEGCSTKPWNYYHNEKATPAGHEEQANNYRAFIQAWSDRPQVGGIIFWEWTSAPGGDDDYHYTPRNKPAERVLREFFGGRHAAKTQE
ncbi:MAG TPA: glycoside hydrolase TIM-barrel-like domain-containing protein [Phycisphaerae bacterium]|nr:glycoside hydrolase TIM-barrel-like domain-containing protein [Phycisphaerae bacterium]